MKRVLMVAYHFPPLAGSSGIQRTLRFAQHLPDLGWEPLVLTISPSAYERSSDDLLEDVPAGLVVHRARGFDAARQLSLRGRYFGVLARPDRWMTWRYWAVAEGMRMIARYRPHVIWATYPIATALQIGGALHRRSGLPWVADLRDPMAQPGYPADPATYAAYVAIESDAAKGAARMVFTTPGAVRTYKARYPAASDRITLIENGYDEESFAGIGTSAAARGQGPIVLLHSGIVYPRERDPGPLFRALRRLREAGRLGPHQLRLRFRAPHHDALLHELAARHGVADFIEVLPPCAYRDALREMCAADALMVLQDAGCNDQIPAKVYEYMRCGKPILGLTDSGGDTAWVLARAGMRHIARLEDEYEIAAILPLFLDAVRADSAERPDPAVVENLSRRSRSAELASLLIGIAG